MNALDDILPRRALSVPAPATRVSLLLGIISGHAVRRRILRGVLGAARATRVVFVVAAGCNESSDDLLRVPGVAEGIGVVRAKRGETPSGTLTAVRKTLFFLEHAARQTRYPWVARADDDVFLHPRLLGRYPALFAERERAVIGVYEWYNVVPASLLATGHSYGARGSRGAGRAWHNCTDARDAACVGPIAFAKGPLVLMSVGAARGVVATAEYAHTREALRTYVARKRIHDDVLLGWWLARVPNLTYVRVPRKHVWLDRTPARIDVGTTLCAHKIPAHVVSDATRAALIAPDADRLVIRCVETPPCTECAHDPTQRTCFSELRASSPTPYDTDR